MFKTGRIYIQHHTHVACEDQGRDVAACQKKRTKEGVENEGKKGKRSGGRKRTHPGYGQGVTGKGDPFLMFSFLGEDLVRFLFCDCSTYVEWSVHLLHCYRHRGGKRETVTVDLFGCSFFVVPVGVLCTVYTYGSWYT